MGLGLDLCVIGAEGHGIEQDQNQREDHQPDQHPGHALPDPFGPAVFDGQLLIDSGQLFGDLVGRGLRGTPAPSSWLTETSRTSARRTSRSASGTDRPVSHT